MRGRGKDRQQSFTAVIRPHLDSMYRLAFRLTGHREEAQDLVQDVLLKLYPRFDGMSGIEAVAPWLCRVLYNQFVDNERRYRPRRLRLVNHPELSADPDRAAAPGCSTEDAAEGEFTITRLQRALARLSDEHRLVIELHDVEGYTLREIADITGIPHGTLKSRRQRARERLQRILDEGPDRASFTSRQERGGKSDELRSVPARFGSVS